MSGVTVPNPMPYTLMMSPGFARLELIPETAPGGRTYARSGNSAATYCFPPTAKEPGASSPGCLWLTVTEYAVLVPAAVVTITCSDPGATFEGPCAFTSPG